RYLLRNGHAKAVLRYTMRGIATDPVLDSHRRVGFNAPTFSLVDLRSPAVRAALLDLSPSYDLVQLDRIECRVDRAFRQHSARKFLVSFLCAELFVEAFQ